MFAFFMLTASALGLSFNLWDSARNGRWFWFSLSLAESWILGAVAHAAWRDRSQARTGRFMKRLKCKLSDCVWESDLKMSFNGHMAVLAGLWMPPCTCSRCGAKRDPENLKYAGENGWLKEERAVPD